MYVMRPAAPLWPIRHFTSSHWMRKDDFRLWHEWLWKTPIEDDVTRDSHEQCAIHHGVARAAKYFVDRRRLALAGVPKKKTWSSVHQMGSVWTQIS